MCVSVSQRHNVQQAVIPDCQFCQFTISNIDRQVMGGLKSPLSSVRSLALCWRDTFPSAAHTFFWLDWYPTSTFAHKPCWPTVCLALYGSARTPSIYMPHLLHSSRIPPSTNPLTVIAGSNFARGQRGLSVLPLKTEDKLSYIHQIFPNIGSSHTERWGTLTGYPTSYYD